MVKIRKATIKDLDKVLELNHMLFRREYDEYDNLLDMDWTYSVKGKKYFRDSLINENYCVFVAEDSGVVVGYLSGEITKGEEYRILPKMAELGSLFVLAEYRSKGMGKKLYDDFVKWAKSKDVKRIRVEASPDNAKGIKYYEKMGFKGFTFVLEGKI